jgi:hypothetical protein
LISALKCVSLISIFLVVTCLFRRRFSAFLLMERVDCVPLVLGMLGATRLSSLTTVAKKSSVPKVVRLPRAKVSPPANADD